MSWGAVVVGGAALAGSVVASQSSKRASSAAGEHISSSADAYRDMSRPYRTIGKVGANQLFDMFGGWGQGNQARNDYLSQYGSDWSKKLESIANQSSSNIGKLNLPDLQSPVNLKKDKIYQQQVEQGMKQLNRRYGAMGSANSSDADNAVSNNLLNYYNDAYNRRNQNALTTYGLKYTRANDIYNRNYNNTMAQYGVENSAEQNYFNRLFNLAQLGANSTAQQGNNMSNSASQMAQIAMNSGNNQANAIGTGIAGILGAYNNYNMYNYLNQNPNPYNVYSGIGGRL